MIRRLTLLLMLMLLPGLAQAQAVTGVIAESAMNGTERIHFVTEGVLSPKKIFTLANPHRVVIDLPTIRATGITLPSGYQGRIIQAVRFGQFDAMTSRIVLDVAVPVTVRSDNAQPGKFILEVTAAAPLSGAALPSAPAASPFAAISTVETPVVPQAKKPLIVIDAGHGGQDPGALGLHKTREKDVTLTFARALEEGLLRTGRYRVALTRSGDTFIMLGERVNIARRMKGDVFISLHADSNPRASAQGLSVYTLSETASDEEAAALAERENKADIISGLDLNTTDEDVASILIDLAQRETMNKSSVLAETVVTNLHPKIARLPSTHRFAGFRVLKAPDIPSILIELGFLSNAQDETLLRSREYQGLVVSSLTKALDDYLAARKL